MNGQEFSMKHFGTANKELVLRAVSAFMEDGVVTIATPEGTRTEAPPDMLHLHGSVSGDPSSFVLLNLSPVGSTGILHTQHRRQSLEMDFSGSGHSMLLDASKHESERTMADQRAAEEEYSAPDEEGIILHPNAKDLVLAQARAARGGTLTLKIDCDMRCVNLLKQKAGNPQNYLAGVIAGTNVIYQRDLGRSIQIADLKLWMTESPYDSGTNSLGDLRKAYQNNKYDLVHLFTGIQEGGVAYMRTACSGARSGYNVGVSSIRGNWKGTQKASAYNWDLIVTAHELGHNVGSGHSHDYSPPIDECVSCRAGFTPAQCKSGGRTQGPVPRNSPKCKRGTIMSYCHLCGGTQNVDMKFHPRAITKIKDNLDRACGKTSGNSGGGNSGGGNSGGGSGPTQGSCADKNSGFCRKYTPKYCGYSIRTASGPMPLRIYCAKSCKQCSGSGGGRGPAPTPPPTPPPTTRCVDQLRDCNAMKNAGLCRVGDNTVRRFLMKACKKSCGWCK
jgi:hypothetical protein